MRWRKQGLLYATDDFAQSPQAVVLADRVRIFFSTRTRDAGGQYVSHVSYVDADRALTRVLGARSAPVLPQGALGCFDEHGIFPMNPVSHGGRIYGFTCGWSRRISVPVETAIGLAISDDDGCTFTRVGNGPVMGPSLDEPFLVGDPFVVVIGGVWHMWYIFGTAWIDSPNDPGPARVYKIAHASSDDGRAWRRDGATIISNVIGDDECQALPTVFHFGGEWHMYFCFRHATDFRANRDRGYRLGYARSRDLRGWTRDDAAAGIDVSPGSWDSDMLCYPHVFWCGDQAYMLYNGNQFGRGGFGVAALEGA